jgi:hypothetical protein
MAITSTQQGVITEAEFAKVVILTTDGTLVPARPVADDDRRDYEIHIRRHFLESLAMQLKTAKRLRLHGRSRMLQINFRVKAPLVSDDRLWYFLAYFDVGEMRFIDPVFLVPSRFFHKHALHGVGRGAIQLQFKANMEPSSLDMWSPFRLTQKELGPRILQILKQLERQARGRRRATDLLSLGGVVWLQPAAGKQRQRRRAA